jgi:YHS domain-containing protein
MGEKFFEREGAALDGHDPVAYFTAGSAVKGSPDLKAEYQGSSFHFASEANRDAFKADPARYAPQYGGFCAFGMARGYKAKTDPAAFTIVDGKLYLNYNTDVQARWSAEVPGYIAKADENWPEVAKQTEVHM